MPDEAYLLQRLRDAIAPYLGADGQDINLQLDDFASHSCAVTVSVAEEAAYDPAFLALMSLLGVAAVSQEGQSVVLHGRFEDLVLHLTLPMPSAQLALH